MTNNINKQQQKRIIILLAILVTISFGVLLRLFALQVANQGEYDKKIIRQSIRKIRIPAKRGKIYTSNLEVLADTVPEINLSLYINEIRTTSRTRTINLVEQLISEMAVLLDRNSSISRNDIEKHIIRTPGLPLLVFKNLNVKELAITSNKINQSEGWALEVDSYRTYPRENIASHLIGYIGKGDNSKESDIKDFSYYIGDFIGKSGIELAFDRLSSESETPLRGLRGYPGYSIVQVDNLGYVRKNIIQEVAPLNGNHVVLTLDWRAQKIAHNLMENQNGAFVLLDADNGDVLASVSVPDFNLDYFSPSVNREYYNSLLKNKQKPLVNKAISGLYSPGSILKPLVALAILESGVSPNETINCDGTTHIGNSKINCTSHRYGGHGEVNLYRALEKSCNDYFIENGLKIGREKIYDMLLSANLGVSSALELPTSKGILPTEEYKQKVFKNKWNSFDTGLISIGQGIITISPLQAAMYTAAFANGGNIFRPHIIKEIVDQGGNVLQRRETEILSTLGASKFNIDAVKQGMFEVVNAPNGSGRMAKVDELAIYGKTGTAEVGSKENRTQNTWFIAFLEYEGRRYAIAVIVEDGVSGGSSCAPLVAQFFREYLQ